MTKKYKAKKNAHFGNNQAQIYGEQLDILKSKNHGQLTTQLVLEDAKNDYSPIHSYFTWQDEKAAEQYRIWEARKLINGIEVVDIIIKDDKEVEVVRPLMFNLKIDDDSAQQYYDSKMVLEDDDLRKRLLDQAMNEAGRWQEKYEKIVELAVIVGAIKKIKKKYNK